jgi:alpha-ketoglutarate-dependent taurine dioxygenase
MNMHAEHAANKLESTPNKIEGAGAWIGEVIQNDSSWIVHWNSEQIAELESAADHFLKSGVALEDISPESFPLKKLAPFVAQTLHELLAGRGFVLLRGLPIQSWSIEKAAAVYMGLGRHMGSLRSSNGKGHLLGHVRDQGVKVEAGVRFYQTNRKLDYHTDSADIVGLLCLQKAKAGGESFIASSMALYNKLVERRPDLISAMFAPYPTDRRGEVPEGRDPWFEIPIFNWYQGHLSCVYLRHYIEDAQRLYPAAPRLTREQVEVMDEIDAILQEPGFALQMAFEQGDIQLLHNHQILHSRNDFENWPDPKLQRHLLRLWIAPLTARPLPAYFDSRWGSVTPGDRGGILVPGTKLSVELTV